MEATEDLLNPIPYIESVMPEVVRNSLMDGLRAWSIPDLGMLMGRSAVLYRPVLLPVDRAFPEGEQRWYPDKWVVFISLEGWNAEYEYLVLTLTPFFTEGKRAIEKVSIGHTACSRSDQVRRLWERYTSRYGFTRVCNIA